MKILMKEIALMRADTDIQGKIYPLKFKVETEAKLLITYTIKHIQHLDEEKRAGNRMKVFRCEAVTEEMKDTLKVIELKYEYDTCKWFLFKM